MNDIRYWFACLFVILPLHGIEQFLFGIDELYELQGQMAAVLGLFPNRDYGIVFMVFACVYLVMLMVYGQMVGGGWRLFAPAFFGVSGLIESHHIIKTVVRLDYFPGALTAIPFVAVGLLLLRAVVREWRRGGAPAVAADRAPA